MAKPKPPKTLRQLLIDYAASLVGIREVGTNAGPFVTKILNEIGLAAGNAWCAALVSHTQRHVGIEDGPAHTRGRVKQWFDWAKQNGRLVDASEAKPGDLVGWLNANGTGHIGTLFQTYFHSPDRSKWKFKSIEGNTDGEGSREGDGVYFKVRKVTPKLFFIRVDAE